MIIVPVYQLLQKMPFDIPLVEAGFNKEMVRTIAAHRKIHVWNKPSFACLGSRSVGTRVMLDRILQVQKVESALERRVCPLSSMA